MYCFLSIYFSFLTGLLLSAADGKSDRKSVEKKRLIIQESPVEAAFPPRLFQKRKQWVLALSAQIGELKRQGDPIIKGCANHDQERILGHHHSPAEKDAEICRKKLLNHLHFVLLNRVIFY